MALCSLRKIATPLTEVGVELARKVSGEEFLVRARKSSILPDASGRRVMNGAIGNQKLKPQADGSVPTHKRFILLLVSNNAYHHPLREDGGWLPVVCYLGLNTVEDDEELALGGFSPLRNLLLTGVACGPHHKRILIGMRTVSVECLPSHPVPCGRSFWQHLIFDVTDHCHHKIFR